MPDFSMLWLVCPKKVNSIPFRRPLNPPASLFVASVRRNTSSNQASFAYEKQLWTTCQRKTYGQHFKNWYINTSRNDAAAAQKLHLFMNDAAAPQNLQLTCGMHVVHERVQNMLVRFRSSSDRTCGPHSGTDQYTAQNFRWLL